MLKVCCAFGNVSAIYYPHQNFAHLLRRLVQNGIFHYCLTVAVYGIKPLWMWLVESRIDKKYSFLSKAVSVYKQTAWCPCPVVLPLVRRYEGQVKLVATEIEPGNKLVTHFTHISRLIEDRVAVFNRVGLLKSLPVDILLIGAAWPQPWRSYFQLGLLVY